MITYCDINTCGECPRYGDDCDGSTERLYTHKEAWGMTDLIRREDAIAYIERVINSGLGRSKSLDYIHKYISALPSADAVSREECDECKTDKEGVLLQQLAELQGDYETMKNAYEDALADAEWIPCSERLPIPPTFCLVTTDGSHGDVIDIALYMSDGWHKASEVLAWMPLPTPYKGGDDE